MRWTLLVWFLFSTIVCSAQDDGLEGLVDQWQKKIVPLKTTRIQVEKIMGHAENVQTGSALYSSGEGKLLVRYSTSVCKGAGNGWNIPAQTVIDFAVYPEKEIKVSEEELLDKSSVQASQDSIVLQSKGIAVTLSEGFDPKSGRVLRNVVRQITFLPTDADNKFRCGGFPKYNPAGSLYIPSSVFREELSANLDQVVSESLGMGKDFVTYLVVYQDAKTTRRTFDRIVETYQNHLYQRRNASRQRVRWVNGGKRSSFSVEVFHLRESDPPPVPSPDFAQS